MNNVNRIHELMSVVDKSISRGNIVYAIKNMKDLMAVARGSSHNHQDWEGGYVDHIMQCLYAASDIFQSLKNKGYYIPFTWESVVIVLVLHDVEKVYKYSNNAADFDKEEFLKMLPLTAKERDAIKYIHGEGDDYQKGKRVMNELCAICHSADVISARLLHSQKVKA